VVAGCEIVGERGLDDPSFYTNKMARNVIAKSAKDNTDKRIFISPKEKQAMINDLITLANDLDQKGLRKEADFIDSIIRQAGELVDLDQRRKEKEAENLLRNRMQELEEEDQKNQKNKYIFVLDDEETWAEDVFIVKVSDKELEQISEGDKITNIISPKRYVSIRDIFFS